MNFDENKLHVFLDLEQTLIDSWDNPWEMNSSAFFQHQLMNFDRLKTEFHIFSFAIWDEADVQTFGRFKFKIESFFNIQITNIITVEQIIEAVKKVRSLQLLDDNELSQLFGKADSWVDFCKNHKVTKAMLFDDKVDNSHIRIMKDNLIFNFEMIKVEFR